MPNATLQSNVAQEMARRRVAEELLPRQARLQQQYGPPATIPEPTPYATFNQPSDDVRGLFGVSGFPGKMGQLPGNMWSPGSAPDAAPSADSPPGNGLSAGVNAMSAINSMANNPFAMVAFPVMSMIANVVSENALDANLADMALAESQVSLDAFGPTTSDDGVGPGPDSATDASSVGAVNGADSASDAAAAAAAAAAATGDAGDGDGGDGGGGGGGGGGGKIVCTAMNQAYGFGAYRQAIWLDYSAKRLTKQHERGYHRIFRPLVRYAFHSGNSLAKRNVRQFLEYIMRLRTADLRAEMRGKNPHPIRRVIRRTCEYICYIAGKT